MSSCLILFTVFLLKVVVNIGKRLVSEQYMYPL